MGTCATYLVRSKTGSQCDQFTGGLSIKFQKNLLWCNFSRIWHPWFVQLKLDGVPRWISWLFIFGSLKKKLKTYLGQSTGCRPRSSTKWPTSAHCTHLTALSLTVLKGDQNKRDHFLLRKVWRGEGMSYTLISPEDSLKIPSVKARNRTHVPLALV